MYLSNSIDGCSDGPRVASEDIASPIQLAGLPTGTYSLIVAASDFDAQNSCGNFLLSMDGDFTGDNDVIFANGFD